jgi:hypothetical protein
MIVPVWPCSAAYTEPRETMIPLHLVVVGHLERAENDLAFHIPEGHAERLAGAGCRFGEVRFDSHFPTKFSCRFPPNSHVLELVGGFWDKIG